MQFVLAGVGNCADASRNLAVTAKGQEKGPRVALVIGNASYPAGALSNPRNDATAIAASLRKLGFEVELKLDVSRADLDLAFRRFSGKADSAAVALLFYAGHGVQVNGVNYIVPIDANPRSERDLKRDMVRMEDVIDDMGEARVKLVFFDACRDNPLARTFSRGGSRGMAAPVEATGTLISFATKHGNTAADGDSQHSPYSAALLDALERSSGVEVEQLLRKVQQAVKQATRGQQEPWRYGSLDGDFYFTATRAEDADRGQQIAIDRAVSEALRRNNEQAARERAELQQSMEKLLREGLARQAAMLEAERAARQANLPVATVVPAPTPAPAPTPTAPSLPRPQLAPVDLPDSGETWRYLLHDGVTGKVRRLDETVKAVVPGLGVMEEIVIDGGNPIAWSISGNADFVGLPIDSGGLFSPYWDGVKLGDPAADWNMPLCRSSLACKATVSVAGRETIVVPAGRFDVQKLELEVWTTPSALTGSVATNFVIWYSPELRRVIKQTARRYARFFSVVTISAINETIELAGRPAALGQTAGK